MNTNKPSNKLFAAIREHLESNGWKVSRNTSGVARRHGYYYQVGPTGRPDLEAFRPHPNGGTQLLFVEVKCLGDVLRTTQTDWMADARAHGALTITAYSLIDVTTVLEKLP